MHHVYPYAVYACGDHAFTLDFGEHIDVNINRYVIRIFHHIKATPLPYILDIIPAYSSITIVYDIPAMANLSSKPEMVIHECFENAMQQIENDAIPESGNIIRIPVCYHPSVAPDLEALCQLHQINTDTLIDLHTQKTYRVFMNGFLPGFAYLGSVDERIATPRHTTPRQQVAAGSVGIAGFQTGIYPFESPGGWQIIGRTTLSLFDLSSDNPCLLKPGDQVQFYSIPLASFSV